ncbi:MAG: DEAD/DEAH box helicase [Chloroflexota bacterium]
MSLDRLLSNWRAEASIASNISDWRSLPARPARYLPIPDNLHPALQSALQSLGITALYTHQAEAWEHSQAGQHVAVVTGTASGKTLCYNLSVLDHLLRNPQACALYIFPTKALAQDQAANLYALLEALPAMQRDAAPPVAIYDGDTPAHSRARLRSQARLLITNPDMLHIGILPHHTRWAHVLSQLQFVVLDEMHMYRGVFGSHVANVLRRLQRLARFYGAQPRFLLASATIANPAELAEKLIEAPVSLVTEDGSGRGQRHFLLYNPPVVDADLGLRRSALQESVRLAEDLLAYRQQTIIFGRSRRTVELILAYLRERAALPSNAAQPGAPQRSQSERVNENDEKDSQAEVIRGYRSGYLPQQRRAIEEGLRQGSVRTVVATNALELGIDIGGMGAAVLVGYPGSIAATWQQAGRAGRGQEDALALLVATADPLDQFLAAHPEYLFERSPEHALINPDNLLILLAHLRCAAFELPFQQGDAFGRVEPAQLAEFLDFLEGQGNLHHAGSQYFWMADQYPAQEISLRSASAQAVLLQTWQDDQAVTIGQVDQASANWMVHPQAIYLHEGQTYLVENLDMEANIAWLRPTGSDYYTVPSKETSVSLIEQYQSQPVPGGGKAYGEILVTSQVTGFRMVKWYTHEQLGIGPLAMPASELLTTGYWLSISEETVEHLRQQGLWNNDPINYGPNWAAQRELARARDGYRCQVCGAPEQGRAHDVHHKTPFRTFTSYAQANVLENLVTLCHACHRRVETAVRVRSGLAGLAYVLSHLAPFSLMCDVGDLGVHADPQSPITDGQPTVVIYDQIPAGIGFSQRLFELHDDLILRARQLVSACACSDGCPSCVGPGGEQGVGGKRETLSLLEALAEQV